MDWDPTTSISNTLSKLLIVSTLSSSIKSRAITKLSELPTPMFAVDTIPTSAKFLRPLVWTRLLTGVFNSLHSIGLLIV